MSEEENKKDGQEEGNEQPKSPLEEARQIRDDIQKEKKELKEEREKLERLKSDQLLSGTGGGHIPTQAPKPLTNVEYAQKVDKGEINPWKK